MRIATRIVAPFVLSSLAAFLGFACTAQTEAPTQEAPAADEATPPVPPGDAVHPIAEDALGRCHTQCEIHYKDCQDHVARRWPRAQVQCDKVHELCLDRCQKDADHAGGHEGEHAH
jgi:hypothetical protein